MPNKRIFINNAANFKKKDEKDKSDKKDDEKNSSEGFEIHGTAVVIYRGYLEQREEKR